MATGWEPRRGPWRAVEEGGLGQMGSDGRRASAEGVQRAVMRQGRAGRSGEGCPGTRRRRRRSVGVGASAGRVVQDTLRASQSVSQARRSHRRMMPKRLTTETESSGPSSSSKSYLHCSGGGDGPGQTCREKVVCESDCVVRVSVEVSWVLRHVSRSDTRSCPFDELHVPPVSSMRQRRAVRQTSSSQAGVQR